MCSKDPFVHESRPFEQSLDILQGNHASASVMIQAVADANKLEAHINPAMTCRIRASHGWIMSATIFPSADGSKWLHYAMFGNE
jgi:hypothetical protein